MRRYWTLAASVLALFLVTYLLVDALDPELLADPGPWLRDAGWAGAAIGVCLLVADQLIPIPSSLVMISLGAQYGAYVGILLALVGRVGMAATGFAIGRAGGPMVERVLSHDERAHADALVRRWGALAVLVSRPLPLLAETVAIVAGTSTLPWSRALLAAALGSLPEAVAYSLAGSIAPTFDNVGLIWGSFVVIAAGFWLVGRWIEARTVKSETPARIAGRGRRQRQAGAQRRGSTSFHSDRVSGRPATSQAGRAHDDGRTYRR